MSVAGGTVPFRTDVLQLDDGGLFRRLSDPRFFSTRHKGRKGGVLVACREDGAVPIVRTTTTYPTGPRPFAAVHFELVDAIKTALQSPHLEFNNATVEWYNHEYRKMGYHTDQSLDLSPGSTICIYSCYNDPTTTSTRSLVVRHKETLQEARYPMRHNSVVSFTTATNQAYVHKIVLGDSRGDTSATDNAEWVGVTFRLSKTFVGTGTGTGKALRLASSEDERKHFMRLKALENAHPSWEYPDLDYTLSPGDLLPVVTHP